ncbi:hypothetical protein [Pararhizobium sp.]
MIRAWIAITIFLALGSTASAAEPFARAKMESTGRIVPGQQVLIDVDILVPDFFTSPPQFPLFDVPDAIVTLPDDRAQNMVETIDGVQYAGIRRTYAVIPEASGTFTLPPVVITFGYSQDGKPVAGETALPAVRFTVEAAPGGTASSPIFAARGLTIGQSFDRAPSSSKTGDAIVRTITIFAENTQAMMIPAIPSAAAPGLKPYPASPKLADGVQAEDRTTGSTRTETITYIAEAEGTFEIPAVSYPWFDVETQSSQLANLPATVVKVSKSAPATTGLAPQVEQTEATDRGWRSKPALLIAVAVLALAIAAWLSVQAYPWMRRKWGALREVRQNSLHQKRKHLLASVRRDDPMTIYKCLDDWAKSAGYGSITHWAATTGNQDAARETETLQRTLFGSFPDHPSLNRAALANAIRKAPKAVPSSHVHRHAGSLPELNVSSTAI